MKDREAAELLKRTEELEAEKELKQAEREAKKLERERKKRQEFLERLVAPILLVVTIGVCIFLAIAMQ